MRLFFSFLTILIFLFGYNKVVFADENFDIWAKTTYRVSSDNKTYVNHNISILNKKEFIFSPTYSISFGLENIGNTRVFNTSGSIPYDLKKENGVINLTINFLNPPKGINTINNFTLSYETDELLEKKGSIYEVDIPGISNPDSFTGYETEIIVPNAFPQIKIIKPNLPEKKNNLVFSKEETKGAGVVLIFGDAQYYYLDLTYNISNPNLFPIVTEVALPPDTNYQKVLIESLSLKPSGVKIDTDGNWLAQYPLLPREKKTINAKVGVMLYSMPREISLNKAQISLYTKPNKYWEVNDLQIKKLADELKTPGKIYEYVVEKLNYDFEKTSSDNERFGAKKALDNPDNAVCLEYADLFVTLTRSAGIPARTVEGYAYTRNSKLRPLSLNGDVLHAWAQYYDFEKKAWIMVDPTWGSTTRGIDYFNNLDLDHIAFVIKGEESTYPIPAGGYKFENESKDLEVSFLSQEQFKVKENIVISNTFSKFSFAGIPISGFVNVVNNGNSFISSKSVTVTNSSTGQIKEYEIKNIPPFGQESFLVTFDTSFFTNSSHNIKIQIDDLEENIEVKVSLIPDLNIILMGGGIFATTGIVTFFTYKTWRVYLQRRRK